MEARLHEKRQGIYRYDVWCKPVLVGPCSPFLHWIIKFVYFTSKLRKAFYIIFEQNGCIKYVSDNVNLLSGHNSVIITRITNNKSFWNQTYSCLTFVLSQWQKGSWKFLHWKQKKKLWKNSNRQNIWTNYFLTNVNHAQVLFLKLMIIHEIFTWLVNQSKTIQ